MNRFTANRLAVRARGHFSPELGGTRVNMTLDTNRAELLLLPLALLFGVILAEAVHQLWVAALIAIATLIVFVRSRSFECGDRNKLATIVRESLSDELFRPAP